MTAPIGGRALPVWQILSRAYACVFVNLGYLFLLAYFPFCLTLIALGLFGFAVAWQDSASSLTAACIVFFACLLFSSTIVAVAWHRFVFMGWESHAYGLRVRFGRREARYLGLVGLACAPFLPALALVVGPLSQVPAVRLSGLALCAVGICLFPRLALALPAAALEQALSLRSCWSWTRGLGLRLSVLLSIPTLVYLGALSVPAWVPGGGLKLFVLLLTPYLIAHFVIWVAVLASVLTLTLAHATGTPIGGDPEQQNLAARGDDVLTLRLDRDFGWLYIVMMGIGGVSLPWFVWDLWGWAGVIPAIIPTLAAIHFIAWRAMVLIEDTAAELTRETLRVWGRFAELTLYLKDIREVRLRRAFGETYVDLTFDDLDRALAHKFLVQTNALTVPYAGLGLLVRVLRHLNVMTVFLSAVKGDMSRTYLGRQVDLYKEGAEQDLKDTFRENFTKYGFHWRIRPIFRNISNVELAREIDRRSQVARTHRVI